MSQRHLSDVSIDLLDAGIPADDSAPDVWTGIKVLDIQAANVGFLLDLPTLIS